MAEGYVPRVGVLTRDPTLIVTWASPPQVLTASGCTGELI